jgi:PmbA protein
MSAPGALAPDDALALALDALRRADPGAAGDCLLVAGDRFEARVRGDEIDFVTQSRSATLGIRALLPARDGVRSAVTSTSDLSAEAVERMSAETVALAQETAPDPVAGLPEAGFASDWPDLELVDPRDREVPVEARIAAAREAEAAARAQDPRIVNSEGSGVGSQFGRVCYANTAGFRGAYDTAAHSLFCEPLAEDASGKQRDSWFTAGRCLSDLENPLEVGRRAAERALRRLGARRVPTCQVPVIFDSVTAPSLLNQLAGCASGSALYRRASFLAGHLGEAVASPLVTIVDDARLPRRLGSHPFDGEGLPTRRNVLVAEGRLTCYLLDSYSARKLSLTSTGSAARGPAGPPSPSASNLWLEPGDASLEELVADTPRGLLVTELIGMGFDPVTGDYSRGAAGIWIEQGRLTHPVEEITIAGNFAEMLRAIDGIGRELVWRGRTAAPPLRVARLTVAGT